MNQYYLGRLSELERFIELADSQGGNTELELVRFGTNSTNI
jgi:hypothetical protein